MSLTSPKGTTRIFTELCPVFWQTKEFETVEKANEWIEKNQKLVEIKQPLQIQEDMILVFWREYPEDE